MYFIKKYLPLLFLGILLAGCEETIEIPYDQYEKKIVVYCMLEPGKAPEVTVMESQSLGVPVELQEEYAIFLTDAVVKISEGANTYSLHLKKDSMGLPNGKEAYFFTDSFHVEIGKTYHLEVSQGGRTVNAETRVLEPVKATSITYDITNFEKDSFMGGGSGDIKIIYHLDNPPGPYDNYELNVLVDNFSTYLVPQGQTVGIIRDSIQEKNEFEVLYNLFTTKERPRIWVNLYNYPKSTADFLESLDDAYYSGYDPFSEVTEVVSNINGGLGLFGARTVSDTATFEIKIK